MPFLSAYKDANDKFERSMKSPSGFAGVSFHNLTGKWQAALGGKYVGLYPTPEAAAMGRYEAKTRCQYSDQAEPRTKAGPEAQAVLKTNAVPKTIAAAVEDFPPSKRRRLAKAALKVTERVSATGLNSSTASHATTLAIFERKSPSPKTKTSKDGKQDAQLARRLTPPSRRTLKANIKRAKTMLRTIGDTAGVSPQLVIKYNRGSDIGRGICILFAAGLENQILLIRQNSDKHF